ncbi:MAG: penicillin-binding protein 1A [Syntrophobacteraceae bacterium]
MRRAPSSRRSRKSKPTRWLGVLLLSAVTCLFALVGLTLFAFYIQVERSLPSIQSLKSYHPPLVTTMYAADGSLIGEFYTERRYIVPLKELSPHLIKAFLAAEDARFYEHGGVDLIGVIRALFRNLQAGEIVQGGSTITQQVVKSLLLTPEKTVIRKVKEAILAYRIDQSLSKDEILYLYLNQIYFGSGAYGVEAASRTYFDKHAKDLNLSEAALLAGLPKAPSRYSPFQNFPAARERQQYVVQRMAESGFITADEAPKILTQAPVLARPKHWTLKDLNHFTEEVRRQIEARYGRDGLYKEGLTIYTTMDPNAQRFAEKALDLGLRELDKRHSRYRGIHVNVPKEDWPSAVKVLKERNGELVVDKIVGALITEYDPNERTCRLSLGSAQGKLPPSGWEWAKKSSTRSSKMFRVGDVVRVRLTKLQDDNNWSTVIEQDPGMEGALLAVNPDTGRVLCMVGGRNFEKSQFNRCTQALRQPGSSFKPIIYSAGLDKGYKENSILIDSPIIKDDHSLRGPWKPSNYDLQFWGPIPLRKALIHSRNVVTVKLLESIGVDYAINYARRLGINSQLTPSLALALGASGVSLWELITAYSSFANNGDKVEPYMIEKVLDRKGNVLEEHQVHRESVIPPQTAYIVTHMLQGVVEEGTGQKAKQLGRPAAGKTGTTNEMKDAWFVGYTPTALTGVWVGYDDHNISLGKGETGSRAACPIWVEFMKNLLKDEPIVSFPIPPGVIFAKINPDTGALSEPDDPSGIYAAFAGRVPSPNGDESYSYTDESAEYSTDSAAHSPYHLPKSPSASESFFKSDLF